MFFIIFKHESYATRKGSELNQLYVFISTKVKTSFQILFNEVHSEFYNLTIDTDAYYFIYFILISFQDAKLQEKIDT